MANTAPLLSLNLQGFSVDPVQDGMPTDHAIAELLLEEMQAAGNSAKTIRERMITLLAFRTFVDQPLATVQRRDLLKFLAQPKFSNGTRQTYGGMLRKVYTLIQDEGLRLDNPASRIPRARVRLVEPNPVTTDELQALIESGCYAHTRTKVLLYAYEGLRASEIAGIRGEHIDWVRGRIWVEDAKGGRKVWRPLSSIVWAHVQEQYPREGWWFPSGDGHVTGRSVSDSIRKAMVRAGIKHRAHDLRKWHGTTLLAKGADGLDVQHSLRHADGQSMKAYVLPDDPRIRAAKERLPKVKLPKPVPKRVPRATPKGPRSQRAAGGSTA